jgi:hypothetical protein
VFNYNDILFQVAEKLCNYMRKPSNQEICSSDACPHWHAGSWSSVSAVSYNRTYACFSLLHLFSFHLISLLFGRLVDHSDGMLWGVRFTASLESNRRKD